MRDRKRREKTTGLRVLVVEDCEPMRNYVVDLLESEGYVVTAATDGVQAMEKFSTADFDIVLTDIAMPGKDGIDTIMEIRELHPPVGIVAMSGVDARESLLRIATIYDADEVIKKPFTREQLLAAVEIAQQKRGARMMLFPQG